MTDAVTSQASLEARLAECWRRVERGDSSAEAVFGNGEAWLLKLGCWQLGLQPLLKRWYIYRRVDDWWADSGHGLGEVVFLPIGRQLGERLLPEHGPREVGAWCVVRIEDDEFQGPLLLPEVAQRLASGALSPEARTWTAAGTTWQLAREVVGHLAAATASPPATQPPESFAVAPEAAPAPSPAARFCSRCGTPFIERALFCARCGAPRR